MPDIIQIPSRTECAVIKKRVAAYARVSMETELLLHSLAAQVSYYTEKIQKNPEWVYAGIYADEGISGTSISCRDGFQRLIKDCEAGKIDIVLVKSISRFARDTVDCLNTIRHLKDIGVEVRFERENISSFTSDGELLLTLLASFAQAESESISENVKWVTRKRFAKGIPNGHKAPYGYRWDGEMFRIIPEQGEIVKTIFQQYLSGISGYRIAKTLKESGVKGQSGRPISESTIKSIISNISYTGTMILQKHFNENHERKKNNGELPRYGVEEMFEPLVSAEEFERAQEIRRQRAKEIPPSVLTKFSGLVKCGNCGAGVSRRTAKDKKKWICNTRERKSTCDMRPLMETELEAAAESALGKMDDDSFRRGVQEIVVFGDRIEFRLFNGKTKSVPREYGGYQKRSGFSGKLICGVCGRKLYRDSYTRKGTRKVKWMCPAPRSECSLNRLSESELRQVAEEVLGTQNPEAAFVEQVENVAVFNDRLEFHFRELKGEENKAGKRRTEWDDSNEGRKE